jgi:hypothetical protein
MRTVAQPRSSLEAWFGHYPHTTAVTTAQKHSCLTLSFWSIVELALSSIFTTPSCPLSEALIKSVSPFCRTHNVETAHGFAVRTGEARCESLPRLIAATHRYDSRLIAATHDSLLRLIATTHDSLRLIATTHRCDSSLRLTTHRYDSSLRLIAAIHRYDSRLIAATHRYDSRLLVIAACCLDNDQHVHCARPAVIVIIITAQDIVLSSNENNITSECCG